MGKHAIAELGFEPGAFGRHDAAGVGDSHEVFDAGGIHGKGAGELAAVDHSLQFGCAPDSAHEVDAFAGAGIINPEDGREDIFLEQRDIEFFDGISGCGKRRAKVERSPFAAEKESELMILRGFWLAWLFYNEHGIEPFEQFGWFQAVQIFEHAIVRQDLHLLVRKDHGEKPTALPGAFASFEYASCGSAAVVAIGDVERRDVAEGIFDECYIAGIGQDPGGMPNAVFGGEINFWCRANFAGEQIIEFTDGTIGEEDGARLSIQDFDVAHAVVFLIRAGKFMLLDYAIEVFLATGGGDQPKLGMRIHNLPIKIEGRLVILLEVPVMDHFVEILFPFCIDARVVEIDRGGEVNLRFADMQEAEGISGGGFTSFRR